jgi:tRNA A-37 threonylcarbamoyl transferase component Bud32
MEHFIKKGVFYKEFHMHEYIYKLSKESNGLLNVPKIISYDPVKQIMIMEKINHMNVSDFYGESEENIESTLFTQIRQIICFLYDNHIIYPDITGYNFIEHDNKVWIIDFEHSDFKGAKKNNFVEKFVSYNDYNKWNPWFK